MVAAAKQIDSVEAYARAVVGGEIVAGRLVRLACDRHLRDLKNGSERGLKWEWEGYAERAINFFSCLQFGDGAKAGKQFALEPFQAFIVGSLFGWVCADGSRRFRTAYIEQGKGNGKSPLAAGVGLYGLTADKEIGAEVYAAAVTKEQAGILFRDARLMAEKAPALAKRLIVGEHNIADKKTNSFFRPIASENRGLDGKRPHIALIDEIHEHPSDVVVDKMRAGTKSRRQALIFEITNSGHDRHSICRQHHEYSAKILEQAPGFEDDSWFAYVCQLDTCAECRAAGHDHPTDGCPHCDQWTDERVWIKANPGLDTILPRKYLQEQVREAQGMPAKVNIVKRLNFCIWTDVVTNWIDMGAWDEGSEPIDPESLNRRECFAAIDLARVSDMSALVLLFPPMGEEKWKVLARFWVPEEDIETRSRRDRVPYHLWRDQGFISSTPGNTTDFAFIGAELVKLAGKYDIREVAFDRTFAGELIQYLQTEGLSMVEFGQGFLSMAAPCAELERLIKAREIQHGGNPVMRWCASNAVKREDPAGNIKPDKEKSRDKIDGIVALAMALGRAMLRPVVASGPSFEVWG